MTDPFEEELNDHLNKEADEIDQHEQDVQNWIDAHCNDLVLFREFVKEDFAEVNNHVLCTLNIYVNEQDYVLTGKVVESYWLKYLRDCAEAQLL